MEISLLRQDGGVVDVLFGTAFLNPDEAPQKRQVAAFLADITGRKQAEEVLRRTEKLAVAGRLAASIAHEINNPLAAVTNCLYLVQNTELSADGRTYLDMAQKELDRVAQITVQTLRFHRQSSRAVESDVAELAGTVLALFEPRMRRQNIVVRRDFRTRRTLPAFEGELRQVIVNLLGNAIDASPAGGEIVMRTACTHHPLIGREASRSQSQTTAPACLPRRWSTCSSRFIPPRASLVPVSVSGCRRRLLTATVAHSRYAAA